LSIASYFNPLGLSSSPLAALRGGVMELSQWQVHMSTLLQSTVPRVIVGAADGRLRVFDGTELTGYIRVVEQQSSGDSAGDPNDEKNKAVDFSPHDGCVNSLALDERTKYLISADSVGDVLIWRQDSKGWYQLLRKLRKETLSSNPSTASTNTEKSAAGLRRSLETTANKTTNASTGSKLKPREQFNDGSILSVAIHPDKMKGMMLMMSRQPAMLKVLNLATYKPFHSCENFAGLSAYLVREGENVFSTGVFYRANFSADGKFIIACSNVSQESDRPVYKLLVWDSYTGQPVPSLLSQLTFAYPVRGVSWHPTQHLIAVAMLGPGAAVVLYTTDSSSASSINQQQQQQQQSPFHNMDINASTTSLPRSGLDRSLVGASSLLPPSAFANESLLLPHQRSGDNSPNPSSSVSGNLISRGNSARLSSNIPEKDMLAYSLLNSRTFVNMRGSIATSGEGLGALSPMMEMSRSNESLLPNMGTLQPHQPASLVSSMNPTGGSDHRGVTSTALNLNLASIAEAKTEPTPSGAAAAPTQVSEAEARINKMARAREILARARAQRAAASAFSDVGNN
jgi:hypothetical protein